MEEQCRILASNHEVYLKAHMTLSLLNSILSHREGIKENQQMEEIRNAISLYRSDIDNIAQSIEVWRIPNRQSEMS